MARRISARTPRVAACPACWLSRGFGSTDNVLEGPKGFVDVFGNGGDLDRAVDGLGRHFELFANAYKPYPSGIVVHAAIDACLEIAARLKSADIQQVELIMHPLGLVLANRPSPKACWEAQVSLQHWAAVALLRRAAGIPETRQDCIDDPAVAALRQRVVVRADETVGRDAARATVTLADGTTLSSVVDVARGSSRRPMTDDELDAKFRGQAETILAPPQVEHLLELCRGAATVCDIGPIVAAELG